MIAAIFLVLALQSPPLLTENRPVVLECTVDFTGDNFLLFINPESNKLAHVNRTETIAHTVNYTLTDHEVLYGFLGSDGISHRFGLSRSSLGLVTSGEDAGVAVDRGYGGCSVISSLGTDR